MPKHMPGKSKREMEAYRQFLDNMPLQPDTLEDNYKYKGDHFEGSNEDKIRTDTIVGQGYYHDDIARELPWYIKIINYFKEKLIVGLIITLIGLIGTSVNEYFQNLNTTVYSNKTDIAVIKESIKNIEVNISKVENLIKGELDFKEYYEQKIDDMKVFYHQDNELQEIQIRLNIIENDIDDIKEKLDKIR